MRGMVGGENKGWRANDSGRVGIAAGRLIRGNEQ